MLIQIIRSFLTGRLQRVCMDHCGIDGLSSDWKLVTAVIPQDSVLGPNLFLLMVKRLGLQRELEVEVYG